MLEESGTAKTTHTAESSGKAGSTADNIRQLTDASRQLFHAGEQITENLSALSDRVEHASNVGSQILRSPWLVAGGAIVAGTLMIALSRNH